MAAVHIEVEVANSMLKACRSCGRIIAYRDPGHREWTPIIDVRLGVCDEGGPAPMPAQAGK